MDSAIDSQLTPVMDRYSLRSKGELSQGQVPASVAVQTCSQSISTQHMLVPLATLFGTGTPLEGQPEALSPAEASRVIAGPTGTDKTSAGLPPNYLSQGPEEADPFLQPTGTRGPDWEGWRAGCGPRAASWTTLA